MSAWQPIETAPREPVDGRMPHVFLSDGQYTLVGWWNRAAERWYNTACHLINGEPLYWQPLPSLPSPDHRGASGLGS